MGVIAFRAHKLVRRDVQCSCKWLRQDRPFYCVLCSTSADLCVECGGLNESLPTHCPGVMMTELQCDCVAAGAADFAFGRWVTPRGNHGKRKAPPEGPRPVLSAR